MRKKALIPNCVSYIKNSLITRFIVVLLVIVVFPFWIVLQKVTEEITSMEAQRAYENMGENLKIISLNVDNCLSSIESLHANLLLDDSFLKTLNSLSPGDSETTYDDLKLVRKIKNVLTTTAVRSNYIRNIYLYCPNAGRLFISNINSGSDYSHNDLTDTSWYSSYINQPIDGKWRMTTSLENGEKIFSSYRAVLSAMLSLNVAESTISSILEQSNPYSYAGCFMIDGNGEIVTYGTSESDLLTYISTGIINGTLVDMSSFSWNGESVYLRHYHSSYSGFTTAMYAYEKDCISASNGVHALIKLYFMDSILLIITAILSVYVVFCKPLRRLSKEMRKSETGDLSVRLPDGQKTEIGHIYHRFNQMNANISRLIEDNYINEIKKRDFELKLLGTQINEHFLYNALDAIRWMAQLENARKAGNAVRALATFYRISLAYGSDMITIQNLFCMIDSYLQIQKILLGERLSYEINISQELFPVLVPKYIFIPLVDNAIQHGIKGFEDGVVCVVMEKKTDSIRFKVTDNGHGIDHERYIEILNALQKNDPEDTDCFALKNLNAQLILFYENYKGIHIDTKEGYGTSIWFDLPIKVNDLHT